MSHSGGLNILHVLSQTELTGSECYALELAEEHRKRGHRVWIISDNIYYDRQAEFTALPVSRRSFARRIRNIIYLRKFIKRHKIDVVHAHSRAASWVCHYATLWSKTAFVSTIHGRQHLHLSMYTKDIYGDRVFAICESLKRHLIEELRMAPGKIATVFNGLEFDIQPRTPAPADRIRIAILGRTSGPKGNRTQELLAHVLEQLLETFPNADFVLAGGPVERLSPAARAQLCALQERYPGRVQALGILPAEDFSRLIGSASAVIGSGRIAIQALAVGVPTYALGESCSPGWVSAENLAQAAASNFGDIVPRLNQVDFSVLRVLNDLREGLKKGLPKPGVETTVRAQYDVAHIAEAVEAHYTAAVLQRRIPRWIPILMYHKVEEQEISSRHKTYITSTRFESHLRYLRWSRFQTLTFSDLNRFIGGELPWAQFPKKPVILTFDDGYVTTFQNAVPKLERFDFRAVFYVLGDSQIQSNLWDSATGEPVSRLIGGDEIRRLAELGHEIGAHSLTHPRLTELDANALRHEIDGSREAVIRMTGQAPHSFAYPYGGLNDSVKEAVRSAGFSFAVATDTGGRRMADDLFQIFRVSIFPQDGILQIWKKTSRWYRSYYYWKRGH